MAPIVGSQRKPSSAFVCTTNADLSSAERKQKSDHLGASLLLMQGKGALDCTPKMRHELKGPITLNGGEQCLCPDNSIPVN